MSAVVSADDRDAYEDNEREEIEMGSAIEENEASYLDEADLADDRSFHDTSSRTRAFTAREQRC